MNIEVRMFMKFKAYLPSNSEGGKAMLSLEEGSTFSDLLNSLAIPVDEPKLVIINGISRGISSDKVKTEKLSDGDVVAIFPPAGGG